MALVASWEGLVRSLGVAKFLVPPPSAVLESLRHGLWGFAIEREARNLLELLTYRGGFYYHLGVTGAEVVAGFLLGSLAGLGAATAMVLVPALQRTLHPYLVAFQSVPRVALAPLFVVWFGFGVESKIVLTAITAFFPVYSTALQGLGVVDRDFRLLLMSWRATPWQELWLVRFPGALPGIFAGLKVAAAFSVVAAAVGEFVGAKSGLGVIILQSQFNLDVASMFAALLLLALVGLALTRLVGAAERRALFWQRLHAQSDMSVREG